MNISSLYSYLHLNNNKKPKSISSKYYIGFEGSREKPVSKEARKKYKKCSYVFYLHHLIGTLLLFNQVMAATSTPNLLHLN